MKTFKDENENRVELFYNEELSAKHCLAIPRFNGQYVFTKHKKRGIEFPGGKVENGESVVEALKREVFEETGGIVKDHKYLGTYKVYEDQPFFKSVYFVTLSDIKEKDNYLETDGAILFNRVEDIEEDKKSSLLKDDCIMYLYKKTQIE